MRVRCYSVRVKEVRSISDLACVITTHDGSSDIFPKSQIFGEDYEVVKCDAIWVSAWILDKKKLTYSSKKECWMDENGRKLPTYTVTEHKAADVAALNNNVINDLKK